MSVRIITDSASDLRVDQAAKRDICVIPMTIRMGDGEYLDGVTISSEEFYQRLEHCDVLPATSQITPHAYTDTFNRVLQEGDEAVVITISGKLSGTVQSAMIAAEEFGDRVHVVDSQNASAGQRILVEYALRLRDEGLGAKEIAAKLEAVRQRVCIVALLDTLEYVVKGGRLSKTAGMAGTVLHVRPVVGVEDGEVVVMGKALGAKKSNNLLTQTIAARGGVDFSMPYMLAYTGQDDSKLREYIENSRAIWEAHTSDLPISIMGSTIGTYAGPGAVAVAFFSGTENNA